MSTSSPRGGTRTVEMLPVRGYQIWKQMFERFSKYSPRPLGEAVVASCLATGTLLTLASPFLSGALARSRLLWRLLLASSVVVAAGILGASNWPWLTHGARPLPWNNPTDLAPMFWFPVFHLLGLLLIRPEEVDSAGVN